MPYIDTSVIVKLYFRETYSRETARWIRENDTSIPLTSLHELEFTNTIHLKIFRKEITEEQANLILSRFGTHLERGVYHRLQITWSDVWSTAVELSQKYTSISSNRTLDILHVASAISLKFNRIVTFDHRQSNLADALGLQVIQII